MGEVTAGWRFVCGQVDEDVFISVPGEPEPGVASPQDRIPGRLIGRLPARLTIVDGRPRMPLAHPEHPTRCSGLRHQAGDHTSGEPFGLGHLPSHARSSSTNCGAGEGNRTLTTSYKRLELL